MGSVGFGLDILHKLGRWMCGLSLKHGGVMKNLSLAAPSLNTAGGWFPELSSSVRTVRLLSPSARHGYLG